MDISQEEKENNPDLHPFHVLSQLQLPNGVQFLAANLQKKIKPVVKAKPQKGFSSNLRVGDWVCLICKNLNFSFRNECNRCQSQTKEQNHLQTMYLAENVHLQSNNKNRFPLQEITNERPADIKITHANIPNMSRPTLNEKDLPIGVLPQAPIQVPINQDKNTLEERKPINNGFHNMLLITPPKHNQNKTLCILKEYSDSSQKELPPYRSPEYLPSISPMLKRVFGAGTNEFQEGFDRVPNTIPFMREEDHETSQDYEEDDRRDIIGEALSRINEARDLYKMTHGRPKEPTEELNLFNNVNFKSLYARQPGSSSENVSNMGPRPVNVQSVEELERQYKLRQSERF